jgi:hypothetical protein
VKSDETLIDEIVSKGKLFFLNFILPELLAKRYSSVKSVPASRDINQSAVPFHSANLNQYICYCQDPAREGKTIMCALEAKYSGIGSVFTATKKLLLNEEKWLLNKRGKTLHVTLMKFLKTLL